MPSNRDAYERDRLRTQLALGELRFNSALGFGRAMGLDVAVQTGLDVLGEVINSPVRKSTMRLRKQVPAGGTLTPREREIVRLVRRGLSNRQIADELVIAEKTAINHLAHILDKFGVHSRVELVARASELGLEPLPT